MPLAIGDVLIGQTLSFSSDRHRAWRIERLTKQGCAILRTTGASWSAPLTCHEAAVHRRFAIPNLIRSAIRGAGVCLAALTQQVRQHRCIDDAGRHLVLTRHDKTSQLPGTGSTKKSIVFDLKSALFPPCLKRFGVCFQGGSDGVPRSRPMPRALIADLAQRSHCLSVKRFLHGSKGRPFP